MSDFSMGLRNYLLSGGSVKAALDGGKLLFFSAATDPALGPDDATTGATLLVTLTESDDGTTGLTFDAATNGALPKAAAETWLGTIANSGTTVFCRFCESGDSGTGASTTAKRVQLTVGVAGTEVILSSATLVANSSNTLGLSAFELDAA